MASFRNIPNLPSHVAHPHVCADVLSADDEKRSQPDQAELEQWNHDARIDRDNPNLGRYSATRRVARTVYLGSAPTQQAANRGIDDHSIKLGCVQPGEAPSIFGDALRKLADQATYLRRSQRAPHLDRLCLGVRIYTPELPWV
jgi:hypothetical protein